MQTKDFPSVIAVKKSTQPLVGQYKNMMGTEQAAPFTPITAADVTDEMVATYCHSDLSSRSDHTDMIAAAVNAYLGAKK